MLDLWRTALELHFQRLQPALKHVRPLGWALQVSVPDGPEVDRARLRSSLGALAAMLEANLKLLVQRACAFGDGPTSPLCACGPLLCCFVMRQGLAEAVHAKQSLRLMLSWHAITDARSPPKYMRLK